MVLVCAYGPRLTGAFTVWLKQHDMFHGFSRQSIGGWLYGAGRTFTLPDARLRLWCGASLT